MKPTWQTDDGRVQLYRGDALKIIPRLDAGCADLVILDPPFAITDLDWDVPVNLHRVWEAIRFARRAAAVTIGFGTQPFFSDLIASNRDEFRYELIWSKSRVTGFLDANRRPLRAHENVGVFCDRFRDARFNPQFWQSTPYKVARAGQAPHYSQHRRAGSCSTGRRFPTSVVSISQEYVAPGQTRKAAALMAWLIRTYSAAGETVLDPFLGSGSTAEAAIAEGRRVIGIELDCDRFALAKRRIKEALATDQCKSQNGRKRKATLKRPPAA